MLRDGILSIYPKDTLAGVEKPSDSIKVSSMDISFVGGFQAAL